MKTLVSKVVGKSKAGLMAIAGMVAALVVPASAMAAPIDFSTTDGIGVGVEDVIGTGFSFMGMFDTWTMLVLAIIFAPVAIGFLIWLFRKLPRLGK